LDPYALVHRSGWWYVVGFCHLRQAVRTFRLDRIEALTLLDRPFLLPVDFDIHAYLETELRAQDPLRARLNFEPQAAPRALSNRSMWEQVDVQPDGSVQVSLVSPDLTWAAGSVLAFGPGVTVLDPPELRAMVRAWALEIARHNAALNHCAQRVTFHQGQWWKPFEDDPEPFAAMVSNPPYIPSGMVDQLEPEVRDHEPRLALDGGEDGLAALRHLVTTAPDYLQPGGLWLVELMAGQALAVAAMVRDQGGYESVAIYPDLAGIERFVLAYTKSGQD